eukprot:2515810-Rhodomonas_salina.6
MTLYLSPSIDTYKSSCGTLSIIDSPTPAWYQHTTHVSTGQHVAHVAHTPHSYQIWCSLINKLVLGAYSTIGEWYQIDTVVCYGRLILSSVLRDARLGPWWYHTHVSTGQRIARAYQHTQTPVRGMRTQIPPYAMLVPDLA